MSEHYQQYPHQQPPPVPPRKRRRAWPWVLLSVGVVMIVMFGGCIALVGTAVDDVSEPTTSATDEPTDATTDEPTDEETTKPAKPKKDPSDGHVIFRVWGKAPSGVDITYGNDGSNHQGKFRDGKFRKRIKLDEGSLYYQVNAQLSGGGNIKCSVKINGVVEKSSASGGYNICSAQINGGITGW